MIEKIVVYLLKISSISLMNTLNEILKKRKKIQLISPLRLISNKYKNNKNIKDDFLF